MADEGRERRKSIRLSLDWPVQYRFVHVDPARQGDTAVHEGVTRNVSVGGLLLVGELPAPEWISPLLIGKILLGVRLKISEGEPPIRALCRTTWLEPLEKSGRGVVFGLAFTDIPNEERERIRILVSLGGV